MNHPGEIATLARMAKLDVAMITTVAAAHLEAFASVDDIAREKASIFAGLVPGGVAVFNADLETSPILRAVAETVGARKVGRNPHRAAREHGNTVDDDAEARAVRAALGRQRAKAQFARLDHAPVERDRRAGRDLAEFSRAVSSTEAAAASPPPRA